MTDHTLDANTTLGHVALTVPNLDRSIEFYRDVLGFSVNRDDGVARLSAGGRDIVALHEAAGRNRISGAGLR